MNVLTKPRDWQPPERVSREDTIARSDAVLAKPDIALRQTEDIFRINALGLDWDMGVMVYEPADATQLARGADGNKIGEVDEVLGAEAGTATAISIDFEDNAGFGDRDDVVAPIGQFTFADNKLTLNADAAAIEGMEVYQDDD